MAAAAAAVAVVVAAAAAEPARPVIEVLDALELASLIGRSGTLDGAVPLRAAQACVPLLEGNAHGLQVRLARPLTIERPLGRAPRVVDERAAIALKAAVPRLAALGLVGEAWARAYARSLVHEHRGTLYLFTGLLVRPPAGTWLRVASSANRRSVAYDVDEVFVPDGAGLCPLLVPLRPRGKGALGLDAEIATLSLVLPDQPLESAPLSRPFAEAHTSFYDAAYFAQKKGASTRKYRRLVPPEPEPGSGPTRVVRAGPVGFSLERRDRVLGPASPFAARAKDRGVAVVDFLTLLPFSATWDGLSLILSYDKGRLAREAEALERAWSEVMGAPFLEANKGALWYLTKYFTPHPPGEPHFFVKPWAFVQTPPGWSSLIDGALGDGFEVMRGVVQTDWFHAAPAVFRVFAEKIVVREGQRLISVLPFPRALAHPKVRAVGWEAVACER